MFQEEASHPATSAQRLEMLCEDPHLRIMVADNPAAPADLLARLATAHFAGVAQGQRLTPLIWFLGRA